MEKTNGPVDSLQEPQNGNGDRRPSAVVDVPLEAVPKSFWDRLWPVMACGAGLFSDGFLNNIISSVNSMLDAIYPDIYASSPARQNVTSIVFAGTVVGMLIFGYTSDKWSRKYSLLISTIILFIFAALAAGSYGYHGSIPGMFAALTAYRFFIGIGIGGEYPAGSVACSESTGELKSGTRNRWFILFTNVMIDVGFVVSSFVPCVLMWIFTEKHLRAAWRVALGLGVIPPLSLLYFRIRLDEPEEFKRQTMKDTRVPYWLVIKFYWWRLLIVSLIWWLYDFSVYAFGLYSTTILGQVLPTGAPLWRQFGWNTVINLFYIPGAVLGSFVSDWVGARYALAGGVTAQAVVGFIMAGCYGLLSRPENIAGFVVVYGIFLSLGELGPGDNIGLIASKTSATCIRGQYYGIAAAFGKIGAFVGTYVFPIIQDNAPNPTRAGQDPFWVAGSLCIFSACLALFCLPHIGQDTITEEDRKFREYLEAHGFDTSAMGIKEYREEGAAVYHTEDVNGPKTV